MNFLNLGLGELLGLVGVISAGVVALYLLDRSKRRRMVATLRFWTPATSRTEFQNRRRIQQPWSLLLQLLSLILLLTAIAGPQLGVFDGPGRAHVLILDTSAWMGALAPQGTLLDQAKADARAYLAALPRRDRVMLLRADAVATPATAFETNRDLVYAAIQNSQAGSSALNLAHALDFAERAQRLEGLAPGEIALVSAGRVTAQETTLSRYPTNLRFIPVKTPETNIGLRRVSLRRSPAAPDTWDVFVAAHNYDSKPHTANLELRYAQVPMGARRLTLEAGADAQASFTYKEKAGGWLEARLNVKDSVPQDDRVVVEVPSTTRHAIVYSDDASLRPLFEANPSLDTQFLPISAYDAGGKADVVVLDGFTPPAPPHANAIWIAPPSGSVIPVKASVSKAALESWSQESVLGAGLYTRDVTLESTEVFAPAPGDITVASVSQGPVIVARDGPAKQVAIGFHPDRGSMKYELATPLLIANILRWMVPGVARGEFEAGTVGATAVPLAPDTKAVDVHVLDQSNQELPFTLSGGQLNFFAGAPGTVRVQLRDRDLLYSLTLPDLAEASWKPPAVISRGIPARAFSEAAATDIWPWLAIAGALGLLADWILFGKHRALRLTPAASSSSTSWRKAS